MNNEERNLISIVDELGNNIEVEVVAYFKIPEFDKKYMIYIKDYNSVEDVVYSVATIVETEESFQLFKIETEEEWTKIKKIMRDMAKEEE